ncbi:MAG: EF-hand domain-containing protein [Stellaceae bacterium]
MTRWTLATAPALLVFALWQPAAAAQPAAATAAGPSYTFTQYEAYRIKSLDRRRQALAERLADPSLPADRKKTLQERKVYYDWLAQMPATERDRRDRRRFDEIDTDHDGTIDPAERAAWRAKQRAYYRKLRTEHPAAPQSH